MKINTLCFYKKQEMIIDKALFYYKKEEIIINENQNIALQ